LQNVRQMEVNHHYQSSYVDKISFNIRSTVRGFGRIRSRRIARRYCDDLQFARSDAEVASAST